MERKSRYLELSTASASDSRRNQKPKAKQATNLCLARTLARNKEARSFQEPDQNANANAKANANAAIQKQPIKATLEPTLTVI